MSSGKHVAVKTAEGRTVAMPLLQQEREIMAVGETNRWPFRVLGVAPVPTVPVFYNRWWLVPAVEDTSLVPAQALQRVQALYQAGIRPKAFIIAHEAPAQIAPPADAPKIPSWEGWAGRLSQHSKTAAKVVAVTAGAAAAVVVATVGVAALATLGLGIASGVLVDPCLIVVTEDDVWILIDSWMA